MGAMEYRILGSDRLIYGPVPEATLLEWIGEGRVQRDTWVHSDPGDLWQRAGGVSALKAVFDGEEVAEPASAKAGVSARTLTRLRAFAELSPEDLEPFARATVEETYRPFTHIVRQGNHGDAMYFVIQGKVGVSTRGQVSESFLMALQVGDTFGEMSLFDPGPRSADVRAETDVVVLKLTAEGLRKVCEEAPAAANRFLWNMARVLAARMRMMDRRAAAAKDMDAVGREVDGA
ncbi:MAG: cyclic nucleotide-binding domain-containing protein [Verrucomicrobiae bacterium]|nr:cyclic nucleotide-binding domain-containing protein [Verrucomicrobiae bacterium]